MKDFVFFRKQAIRLHLFWLYNFFKNIRETLIDWRLTEKKRQGSILFSRRISRLLINHFIGDQSQLADDRKGFLGFGLIHYSLIRNLKPQRILCVGSKGGFIPALCALACQDNDFGQVDFVDPGFGPEDPQDKFWGGTGFWGKGDVKKHFSLFDLGKRIKHHQMTSSEFKKAYPKKIYDYIYLDGDHSYQGIKRDYQSFWPQLKKGGLMILHDIVAKGFYENSQCEYGVYRFWQELSEKNKITFPFPKNSGLGILQK